MKSQSTKRAGQSAPQVLRINTCVAPRENDGYAVIKNRMLGEILWSPETITLLRSPGFRYRRALGLQMYEQVRERPVLNARVLDVLLSSKRYISNVIPCDECASPIVPFWGTLYRCRNRQLWVRALEYDDGWYDTIYSLSALIDGERVFTPVYG